jgi:cell division septation protein DedD
MRVGEKGCVISGEKFARLFFRSFSRTNAKILAWDSGDAAVWKEPGLASFPREDRERSMHEVIDEEELTPVERRRDAELTLGPMTVTGLFFGLVLLCGLCFGLGYSMGRGGGHDALAVQPSGAGAVSPAASSVSKPKAAPPIAQPQGVAEGLPTAGASSAGGAAYAQTSGSTSANGANSAQYASALMVQIATVSHQEDADVLVGALRKRGFEATVSRDAADGQLHVRIGPFTSLSEANAMREKLTNDGYNAVVQP